MNSKLIGIFLAAILLPLVTASDLQLSPVAQSVSGTHASTVSGSFVVTALANATNIEVKSTNTNISFSPNLFSLVAGANQTVNFAIGVAPKTAPGQYTIPFTVGNATHTTPGSITLTVSQSPALTLTNLEISKSNKNGTMVISNTGNIDLNNILLSFDANTLKDEDGRQITLTMTESNVVLIENNIQKNALSLIKAGESKTIAVSAAIPSSLNIGDYTATVNASSLGASAQSQIKIVNSYCKFGRIGSILEIQRVDDESSEDEFEWKPLDKVTLEVRVRNNGDNDEDVEINVDLYDPDKQEFLDLDAEETISIDEGTSETVTFTIEVPDDAEDKYLLKVKAFVEGEEDEECTDLISGSASRSVRVQKESHDVTLTNFNVPATADCGETLHLSVRANNVGRNDEEDVKVNVYSRELGIDEDSLKFDLDEGDTRTTNFDVKIPQNLTAKNYDLNFIASFDYDDDDDTYGEESDIYKKTIAVGNCQLQISDTTKRSAAIAAELLSEVKAGEQISIRVSLKNTGDAATTYTLGISGIDEWATLDKIDPQSVSLEKGESKDILVSLNAKPEASGEKEFTIRAVYAGKLTEQKVALEIQPSAQIDTSKITEALRENWFIWLIVLINIILIILIIVAARRLAK